MLPLAVALSETSRHARLMDNQSASASSAGEDSSDRTLVEATLAGDSDALAILHRRYYLRIYRLALVRCNRAHDAEDIAAETFVRAITHLAAYRFQGESLFPWLARIATNLAADERRRNRGLTFVSLDGNSASDAVAALIDALPGSSPDPHRVAEQHEVRVLVRAAIASLPADQADAILLRFLGDLSLREIAAALGKTEGAIKSLLHRAIGNLRAALSSGDAAAAVFGHVAREGRAREEGQTAWDTRNSTGTASIPRGDAKLNRRPAATVSGR